MTLKQQLLAYVAQYGYRHETPQILFAHRFQHYQNLGSPNSLSYEYYEEFCDSRGEKIAESTRLETCEKLLSGAQQSLTMILKELGQDNPEWKVGISWWINDAQGDSL